MASKESVLMKVANKWINKQKFNAGNDQVAFFITSTGS